MESCNMSALCKVSPSSLCWRLSVALALMAYLTSAKPHQDRRRNEDPLTLPHHTDNKELERCLQFVEDDDCEFYTCLDNTLGCQMHSFRHSVGRRTCHQATINLMQFSSKGRLWALQMRTCMLQSVGQAVGVIADCSTANGVIASSLHQCAQQHSVCDILDRDKLPLLEMFGIRSWLQVIQISQSCPANDVNNFIFWAMDKLQIYR